MLSGPETAPHRVYGYDRCGPVLPTPGPIIQVIQMFDALGVIQFTGGNPPTATYMLRDGDTAWQRLWLH